MDEARLIYMAEIWKVKVDGYANELEPPKCWIMYRNLEIEPRLKAELESYGHHNYFADWISDNLSKGDEWLNLQMYGPNPDERYQHDLPPPIPKVSFDMCKVDTPTPRTAPQFYDLLPVYTSTDDSIQQWRYSDTFLFDFTFWPEYFWLVFKFDTHSIRTFLNWLNLAHLLPFKVRDEHANPFIDLCITYAVEQESMGVDKYDTFIMQNVYVSSHITGIPMIEAVIEEYWKETVERKHKHVKPQRIEIRYS